MIHLETWPCTKKFVAWTTTKFGVEAFWLFVTFCANAVLPPPCLLGNDLLGEVAVIEALLWVQHQNVSGWVVECMITVTFCHQSQHNG